MKIDLLTLFPEMCEAVLSESIIGRARKKGIIGINCVNFRDYTENRHGRVDDYPYGGGRGMVLSAQPIYDCYRAVVGDGQTRTVYMSPQGRILTQQKARELAELPRITVICGHYEGVDRRLIDEIVDEEISVGDYVVTGGELPALILIDAVCRMVEGVLSDPECFENESLYNGLLEYPQYTRPEVWRGRQVPEVLLCGDHEKVREWRERQSIEITRRMRPELLNGGESGTVSR